MIFRASEPSAPRGDKPNREIVLALLAMSLLVAVMIRYSRSLWCDQIPMLCIPDRVGEESVPSGEGPDLTRPGAVAPGSEGLSGGAPGATGGDADRSDSPRDIGAPVDLAAPGIVADTPMPPPTQRPSPTAQRSFPSTATARPRPSATSLATRSSAGGSDTSEASATPEDSSDGAAKTSTPSPTEESGGDDESYPKPETTRFPTRTPSPTPEGYPGP